MTRAEKVRYFIKQELAYLPLSIILSLVTLLNHDINTAARMFLNTFLFFQLVIIILGWKVITKK